MKKKEENYKEKQINKILLHGISGMKRMNTTTRMTKSTGMTWITGMKGMTRMTWGQFNKTFTPVIYKCSYCSRALKQRLHL